MNHQWRVLITLKNTLYIDGEYRYKLPHFVSDGCLFITHIYLKSSISCTTIFRLCDSKNIITTIQLEQNYISGISKIHKICLDVLCDLDHLYYICVHFPSAYNVWELCVEFSYVMKEKSNIIQLINNESINLESKQEPLENNLDIIRPNKTKSFNKFNSIHLMKKHVEYKKKQVPKTLKCKVWDTYIGKEKGIGKCFMCESEINSKHFECGHIIAERAGGTTKLDNLRPVCSVCNKSIGQKNMLEFKNIFF